MEKTFTVHEFAQLAGVSVRTLHYYDQAGLLRAARRGGIREQGARSKTTRKAEEFGVREYRQRDLLRLQQILTLKHLGFSLSEIREMLESPRFDVREALDAQESALKHQIEELQSAVQAIQIAKAHMDVTGDANWEQITAIILAVKRAAEHVEWVRQYYTDAQLAHLYTTFDPGAAEAGTRTWERLIARFRAVQHLPPDHPDVQGLAAERADLIQQFTKGDAGIEASLRRMYADPQQIPAAFRNYDEATLEFMRAADAVYQAQSQTKGTQE